MHNTLVFIEKFIQNDPKLKIGNIDFCKEKTLMFIDPIKTISSGKIRKHIRFSEDFILVENVLHGFKKKFLESITILTNEGNLVKTAYRIRNTEYNLAHPFRRDVTQAIKEFLVLNSKSEEITSRNIEQLYSTGYQQLFYNKVESINLVGSIETYAGDLRQTGKTTRTVDRIVQELFTRGKAFGYENRNDSELMTREICERVERRLQIEHRNKSYSLDYRVIDGIYCGVFKLLADK